MAYLAPRAALRRHTRGYAQRDDVREVVEEGETGYLVPFDRDPVTGFPRDAERFARDLASRIHELLEDEGKCRRFGDAGRRRAEKIFSWTAIARQTIALYEQLIEEQKAGKRR